METFELYAKVEQLKQALLLAPSNKPLMRRLKKKLDNNKLIKQHDPNKYQPLKRPWEVQDPKEQTQPLESDWTPGCCC
jgi:hypothetical protein